MATARGLKLLGVFVLGLAIGVGAGFVLYHHYAIGGDPDAQVRAVL